MASNCLSVLAGIHDYSLKQLLLYGALF